MGGTAQAETVKIGVVLPFSGANADLGHQIDKAFDLYVKLHAKDIAPHKVEIIKRDEGPPTGAQAKTVATELITNDKVQILTGFVFSPSAIALAPVVTQAKVPMVIANAGTAWITNLSPYIARLSFSMWHHGYPMGAYASSKIGCKTAAIAYTDFPPGKDSTEAFKTGFEKAGGKVTEAIPMGSPVQVPDFTPFFQRIKDAKPDCMYVFIPSGAHATGVMKTYGELGMRKAGVKLIGPMDLIPDNKLQDMGDAAIGTIVMGNYAVDLDNADEQGIQQGLARSLRQGLLSGLHVGGRLGHHARDLRCHQKAQRQGRLTAQQVIDAMKGWTSQRSARHGHDRRRHPRHRAGRVRHGSHPQAGRQAWHQGSRHHQGGQGRVQGAESRPLRLADRST